MPSAAPGQSGAPSASARPDTDSREGAGGDTADCQLSLVSERDGAPQPQEESSGTSRVPSPDPQRVHSSPELVRPLRAMDQTNRLPQVRRGSGCVCSFWGAGGGMSPRYETGMGNWERGAMAEPPTKPSPWGWHLPQPLPRNRAREGSLWCPSAGISSCCCPGRRWNSCGVLPEPLTGPALGRAHLEQTQPCTSQG